MTKRYISPQEAAKALGITDAAIRQQCRKGQIKGARKVGPKLWRIPIEWLEGEDDEADRRS